MKPTNYNLANVIASALQGKGKIEAHHQIGKWQITTTPQFIKFVRDFLDIRLGVDNYEMEYRSLMVAYTITYDVNKDRSIWAKKK